MLQKHFPVTYVPSLFLSQANLKPTKKLIQEKSHLIVKNVPNHFLRRSHSPVHCSLFNKRKSVVSFKDSKNCLCPLFSSIMSLSMFWLLRRSLTMILQRIFEWRKESCWVLFQIVLSWQLLWQRLSTLFPMTSFHRYY